MFHPVSAMIVPTVSILARSELSSHNAKAVPISVISENHKKLVYLYKGGKSIPADITTGIRDSSSVQVLSGLNVGDTVITTGLLFLRPGADVKLKKIQ